MKRRVRILLRPVFCAIDGHQPQLDRVELGMEDSHYPHPCWCGRFFGEHIQCDCAEKWNAQIAAEEN